MMDDRTLNLYLSRILSGHYVFLCSGRRFKIKYPDAGLKYEAECYSAEEKDKNKFQDWLTENDIDRILIREGLWSNEHQEFLDASDKTIEDLKVNIYQNFRNPSALSHFRKLLKTHLNRYMNIYAQKHCYDYLTLEGYCDLVKNNFILFRSIYNSKNKLCFFGNKRNAALFDEVSLFVGRNAINPTQFREIARSGHWSYYWNSKQAGAIFGAPVVEWTDEQRILVAMTRMYDGAREHTECPDDDVFEDDDAFDGWAIMERRRMDKERSQQRAEKMLPGNLKNSGEIFVMARNRSEAKDIMSLNDAQGEAIIKERKAAIKRAGGQIDDKNLPDVQRDIIITSNEQRMQNFRNKK